MSSLAKMANANTVSIATEEIRKLMQNDITDNERMIMFLNALSDTNEHMKPQ